MVSRTPEHEKEFVYYRKKIAPAKLSIEDINPDYIKSSKIIYASGVTQSLSMASRESVKKAFEIAKGNNVITSYDPNYSPSIHTQESAKENFNKVISDVDILFMSTKNDTVCILELNSIENITLSDDTFYIDPEDKISSRIINDRISFRSENI